MFLTVSFLNVLVAQAAPDSKHLMDDGNHSLRASWKSAADRIGKKTRAVGKWTQAAVDNTYLFGGRPKKYSHFVNSDVPEELEEEENGNKASVGGYFNGSFDMEEEDKSGSTASVDGNTNGAFDAEEADKSGSTVGAVSRH